MMRAVVHDMEEIITGDIIKSTKYASPEILALLKRLEEDSISKVIEKFDLPIRWEEDWRQAKTGRTGTLLKIADTVAVAMTCYREIRLYSNNQFISVAQEASDYINKFNLELSAQIPHLDTDSQKIYQFLSNFLVQTKLLLEEIIPR